MAKTFIEFEAGAFFKNINRQFAKNIKKEVIPQIIKTIKKGASPVKGKGRYDSYSESYKKAIDNGRYQQYGKKKRPANLTLSGKMLRAFKTRGIVTGGVTIYNSNKLSKYHNDLGAGKSKVIRKMLPSLNEKFIKPIQDNINNQLESAIAKAIRK